MNLALNNRQWLICHKTKPTKATETTVIAILMLYKITKAIIYSFDGDTDFFDIVAGFL